jgi:putative Holliday junction resolvase
MAFDFGEARIGVAFGNDLLKIAHPLTTVMGKNKHEKLDKIGQLIKQWQPNILVVGVPSQTENKQLLLAAINKFVSRLKHRFNLVVELVVEDYSSYIASEQLDEQLIYGIKQKKALDQLAACAILQRYFAQK